MENVAKISSHIRISEVFLCLILLATILPAYAVDWNKVAGKDIILMYPGQTSFQWLLSSSQHKGSVMVEKGRSCRACHSGQEADIGQSIQLDKTLDAKPAKDLSSSIPLTVKAAHDGDNLFLQLQWTASDKETFGVSVMFDDASITQFKSAGCWLACHSDSNGMSKASAEKETSKYLLSARDKKEATSFTEYWQAIIHQKTVSQVLDGYVADKRYTNTASLVKADAKYQNGQWTLILKRKLQANESHRKSFMVGKVYSFGVALHIGQQTGRYHLASFEYSLALDGGRADFVSINQSVSAMK